MTQKEKIIEIIKHGLPQEVAELKADEILRLFDVIKSVCLCDKPVWGKDPNDEEIFCTKCGQAKRQTVL